MEAVTSEMPAAAGERPPPTGEGLTFEKVWAMMQETDRLIKETRLGLQETDQIVKENALLMKETERKMQETNLQMKETDRRLDRIGRQMGDLHNSFGEIGEHLVAPGIVRRFDEMGLHFDKIKTDTVDNEIYSDDDKLAAQIDILLENSEYIMAVEVKTKPKIKDIEHHFRRLRLLRAYADKNDSRKIQGAIAGAVFGTEEKQATIEAGLYVIEQSGDTMKIDIPDGFVPREW